MNGTQLRETISPTKLLLSLARLHEDRFSQWMFSIDQRLAIAEAKKQQGSASYKRDLQKAVKRQIDNQR
jgi:hypothetical protein